jgi:hypothetical protein
MSSHIVETIQKKLGYPELKKIDPNTQEVKHESSTGGRNFGQAAIPAVLLALYKYGTTEHGADELLRGIKSTQWIEVLFGDKTTEAIQKVAAYSGVSTVETEKRMEDIATEAVREIREHTPNNASFKDAKSYILEQRTNILMYLPAELQMGYLLKDPTLDDRTNKMDGPMSGHMHFLEKLFAGGSTEKNERGE